MNKFVKYGSLAVLSAALFVSGANAAEVMHTQENAKSPIASSTMVPPGYNMFFISVERCSMRSWKTSASACFCVTTAPMYFRKSMPHFSHLPPVRCWLWHDGHS